MKEKKLYTNKEYLLEQYINNKKSIEKISIEIDCSIDTIYRWLVKFNIPIRTKSEALKGKLPWSKGLNKNTDERLKRISDKLIELNKDIDRRNTQSIKMKEKWSDNIWRETTIRNILDANKRPEVIERRKKANELFKTNFIAHKKISKSISNLWKDEEWSKKNINSVNTPEERLARSKRAKAMWQNEEKKSLISSKISKTIGSIEYQQKVERNFSRRPTKPEKILYNYIILYQGWEYSGNGSYWIPMSDGIHRKNPDFKNEFENKVIEVFGDYWHKESEVINLTNEYNNVGWKCFIIWEHEVKHINNNKDFLDFLCCNKPYIDQYGELVL